MYEERVSKSQLPESPELRRTVFRPDPEGTPRMYERLCERLRVAATAMWYVMGTMGQADAQEELKAALYDLYEKHGKSVDGLKQELLDLILRRRIRRLALTHKDRLLRFGAELVFALCELQGIEIVIIHAGEQPNSRALRKSLPRMCLKSSPCSAPGCTAHEAGSTRSYWIR